MSIEVNVAPAPSESRGFDSRNLMGLPSPDQRISFNWVWTEVRTIGGVELELEILDRRLITPLNGEPNPSHQTIATWYRGNPHPDLGLSIHGWTGLETVAIEDVYASPDSPQGRRISREKSDHIVRRLKEVGIEVHLLSKSWRKDPLLVDSYNNFAWRLQSSDSGDRPVGPAIPSEYLYDVLELPQNWGPQDRETEQIGVDNRGDPILAHHLHRHGRGQYIGTVVRHVFRVDEILRVKSLGQLDTAFQVVSDTRETRIDELKRRRLEAYPHSTNNGVSS